MYLKYILSLVFWIPTALGAYEVRPYKINLSSRIPHLKDLAQRTKLPSYSVLGSSGAGVPLLWLKDRQSDWLSKYDWSKEEASLNKKHHASFYSPTLVGSQGDPAAVDPWMARLILRVPQRNHAPQQSRKGLKCLNTAESSFHVIVPSMPGYGFSSPAPIGWNLNKTAYLFDTLITKALNYKSYVAAGGDWTAPTYNVIANDPRFVNETKTLTKDQKERLNNNTNYAASGNGYFIEQATRPATIGLALYDNPVGQLAWIGEKFLEWSDPQFGVPPSTINDNTILTAVSIYYLTGTFETSVNTYFQNPTAFSSDTIHASTDIPAGFAAYRYDLQSVVSSCFRGNEWLIPARRYFPDFYLPTIGNFVYYADHPRGGHFAALDNPGAVIEDLRTMMGKWYQE
ncbi:hypothetical protein FRC09_000667 [Ceratobasidium sp. 395]|nr:hypothetical protein FRC09_000667 [Ceratobasidium sp. 395]